VNYRFTIVTFHYKGARFLDSLKDNVEGLSGSHSYEWIVVDDFSNDDESYAKLASISSSLKIPFKIIYLEKNYLAAQSLRRALMVSEGEFVILLDQDDKLVKNALDTFDSLLKKYEHIEDIAGVCGRCVDQDQNLIGNLLLKPEVVANEPNIRHSFKLRGELFQCSRADVLRDHASEFKCGYTMGWLWNRISRTHKYVYTNSIVRMYSTNNLESVSAARRLIYIRLQYEQQLEYIIDNSDLMILDWLGGGRLLLQFCRIAIHCEVSLKSVIDAVPCKLWICIVWPLACVRVIYDKLSGLAISGR